MPRKSYFHQLSRCSCLNRLILLTEVTVALRGLIVLLFHKLVTFWITFAVGHSYSALSNCWIGQSLISEYVIIYRDEIA